MKFVYQHAKTVRQSDRVEQMCYSMRLVCILVSGMFYWDSLQLRHARLYICGKLLLLSSLLRKNGGISNPYRWLGINYIHSCLFRLNNLGFDRNLSIAGCDLKIFPIKLEAVWEPKFAYENIHNSTDKWDQPNICCRLILVDLPPGITVLVLVLV